MCRPPDAERIAARGRRGGRLRHLCGDTIRRVAARSVEGERSPRRALRRAKRKLKRLYLPHLRECDPAEVAFALAELPPGGFGEHVRDVYRWILQRHASMRERLRFIESFYERIFAAAGPPASLLDVGCGFGPLALPWMHLPDGCAYHAWDIDCRVVALLGGYLAAMGVPGGVECRDVLVRPPTEPVDVVLLLKMLPCLEQQEPGCLPRLLRELPARRVVLSFALRPAAGRDGGAEADDPAAITEAALAEAGFPAERLEFPTELVFVAHTRGAPPRRA